LADYLLSWLSPISPGEKLFAEHFVINIGKERITEMSAIREIERPTVGPDFSSPVALDTDDEAQLVSHARNGDASAIEQLVSRYESRLFRLARNITGNREDAEEVVQSVLVKAFRNLARFRGDSRFYTWLVRIAVNESLMKIRGRPHNQVSIDDSDETDSIPRQLRDCGPNPEQRYSQDELRRILTAAVAKLRPGYRAVFQLCDVEGFSTQETAETLSLSIPTVKTRLRRARLRLRDLLDVYFRPPKEGKRLLALEV
jgi:RNA polymerase sigma-70 factor (ECF subfamily)